MASGLYIDLSQFTKATEKLKLVEKKLLEKIDLSLSFDAVQMAGIASVKAPVDLGGLHTSIHAKKDIFLEKHITVNAYYAAFVEFGTGAHAAAYVGTLPATWQEFAAQFKGQSGGGDFDKFVSRLFEWVKSKGLRLQPKVTGQEDNFTRGVLRKDKKAKKQTIKQNHTFSES